MVWLERKDSNGAGWRVIAIDGYMPERNKLEKICKDLQKLNHRTSSTHEWLKLYSKEQLFTEIIKESRMEYWKKLGERADSPYECPCDVFLVRMGENTPVLSSYAYLYQEFARDPKSDEYFQLLVFQSGCAYMDGCTQNILETLDSRIKPKTEYENYGGFVKDCERIMEGMFEVYVAPCLTIKKKLENSGLDCLL